MSGTESDWMVQVGRDLRGHGRELGFYLEPPCVRVLGRPPGLVENRLQGQRECRVDGENWVCGGYFRGWNLQDC